MARMPMLASSLKHYDYEIGAARRSKLLDRAADLRKHVVGVRPDQTNRAYNDYQDDRQHHRVLGDVLTAIIGPKLL